MSPPPPNLSPPMKGSVTSTLQATSKARRLLSPNLDFEEDDVYEPDILTEEEVEEQEAEVVDEDPNALHAQDAPSQEVGPTTASLALPLSQGIPKVSLPSKLHQPLFALASWDMHAPRQAM
ncbi:hypothetical protein EDC04DRAFT_2898337 [Pisolithus marmoratus]|nr:hypothetical protein EDC04DRAFT_2898337 [Pisolithus marmoratus]